MSYQEYFQSVKYYLSRISTPRKYKAQKIVKFSFLDFSTDFNLGFNYYGTLNMFLLSVPTNFYIEVICIWGHEKILARGSCLLFVSMSAKPGLFCFGKFSVELVLKSFSGRNSVEATALGFSNSLLYDLE